MSPGAPGVARGQAYRVLSGWRLPQKSGERGDETEKGPIGGQHRADRPLCHHVGKFTERGPGGHRDDRYVGVDRQRRTRIRQPSIGIRDKDESAGSGFVHS